MEHPQTAVVGGLPESGLTGSEEPSKITERMTHETRRRTRTVKAGQEVLAPNAFIGKKDPPTNTELTAALGPAKPLWDRLVSALLAQSPELVPEWKSSSPKLGWGLRMQQKKRTIVSLSPCVSSFRVGFVLGERALAAARAGGLPKRTLDLIANAPKYAEGTGIRIEVTVKDVAAICKLAKVKLEN